MKNSFLLVLATFLLSTQISVADALGYQYKSYLKLEHNSNKLMQDTDTESTNGAILNNSFELFKNNTRSESYLRAVMLVSEYSGKDKKIHSDEDYSFFYGSDYSWPRLTISLDGDHTRQSTYLNEIEDAGIKENSKYRITNNLTASATYLTSPRTVITLDVSVKDLAFPDSVPIALSEYTYLNKSISASYSLTKKNRVVLSLFETDYDGHSNDTEIDTIGYNLSLAHVFNPIWKGSLMYGERDSDFTPACLSNSDCTSNGKVYNFSLQREGVKSGINLNYRKTLTPNSTGNLNETKELAASYKVNVTPRLSSEFKYQDYKNESLNRLASTRDKSNEIGTFRLHYALNKQWYVTGIYTHKKQEFPNRVNASRTDSNALFFLLGFNGNKTGFSL